MARCLGKSDIRGGGVVLKLGDMVGRFRVVGIKVDDNKTLYDLYDTEPIGKKEKWNPMTNETIAEPIYRDILTVTEKQINDLY